MASLITIATVGMACYKWAQGTLFISLRNTQAVLDWQARQHSYIDYLAFKKLAKMSKKSLPDSPVRDQAVHLAEEISDVHMRKYQIAKEVGFDRITYVALSEEARRLNREYQQLTGDASNG